MQTSHLDLPFELKALSSNEIEGHGSVFGNVDLGGDIVMPGAFQRSLAKHRADGTVPQMFWMHQMDRVPGKWTEIQEDERGLYVKGTLADTELGREMRTLAKMSAVRGLSIGYVTEDMDFDRDGNRLLKQIDLWEVSLVSLAMNPQARIEGTKSRLSHQGEYVPTRREFESLLRKAKCSKSVARRIVACVYDDDTFSGGTLETRWDAGDVDQDATEALKAIEELEASLCAGALQSLTKAVSKGTCR